MKTKSLLINISTICISFIAILILVEVILQLMKLEIPYQFMPQKIVNRHFSYSDHSEFTLRKNYKGPFIMSAASFESSVQTNSRGWRDDEPDDRLKVLVLGDSFVFGFGVNRGETIPDRLEAYAQGVDFVNLGFAAGRSPDSYATFLRYHTELQNLPIILIVYSNDLNDMQCNVCLDKNRETVPLSSPNCLTTYNKDMIIRKGMKFEKRGIVQEYTPLFLIGLLKRSYLVGLLKCGLSAFKKGYIHREIKAQRKAEDQINDREFDKFTISFKILKNLASDIIVVTLASKNAPTIIPFYQRIKSLLMEYKVDVIHIPSFDNSFYWKRDAHYNPRGTQAATELIVSSEEFQNFLVRLPQHKTLGFEK